MRTTDKILEKGAAVFRERFPVYGANAPKIGNAMHGLFPDGITLHSPEAFTRFYLLMMNIVKTSRYANNFNNGGHADSAIDAAVYMAMLQSTDDELNGKEAL